MNNLNDFIKEFILFCACILYSPFRVFLGGGNEKNKILIIQMAKLGDMVCTTPMFRAIKEKYPNAKVYVVGNKINKEILEGNSDVDEYITFSNPKDVFKTIRKKKIDFACITSPSFIHLAILFLANVKRISAPYILNGHSPYESFLYKTLVNFVIKKPHYMSQYAPREYLRLLEPIDIFTEDTKKHLNFSSKSKEKVDKYMTDNRINENDFVVGISPSAGNKIKKWPEERFAKITDYLFEKYNAKIIIIGSKRDKEEVGGMIKHLKPQTKVYSTLEMFSIDELKCLISYMDLFISVDTGPIYIAEAYNVPTIDIVGPVDEKEQPPISKIHRVVFDKNREKPELFVMNAREYNEERALGQIDAISVQMVIDEIDDLYKTCLRK